MKTREPINWVLITDRTDPFSHVGLLGGMPVAKLGQSQPPIGVAPRWILRTCDSNVRDYNTETEAKDAAQVFVENLGDRLFAP